MPIAAPISHLRLSRTLVRAFAVLAACLLLAATPTVAAAQSLMQEPETKQQADQAASQSSDTSSSSSTGNDDGNTIIVLLVVGGLLIGGAAWYILRDSGDSVRDRDRSAPRRPVERDAVGRGAPKAMFTGEGEPGGQTGKRKKRDQGKRQRQARKANRPR